MTTIAVLGATSHIAGDFIAAAAAAGYELRLFSRRALDISTIRTEETGAANILSMNYDAFGSGDYDAIINFVGIGDPARALAMGMSILTVTEQFDALALSYLEHRPATRYIFLSSGAVYGGSFQKAADDATPAVVPINNIAPEHYYTIAKLYAEARHRILAPLPIVDIRVFSYISRSIDISSRFFLTDVLRAIRGGQTLKTVSSTMHRDYVVPSDFFALVECILRAPPTNIALDIYSKAPIEKFSLLDTLQKEFGLQYEISAAAPTVLATGIKQHYYSQSRKAELIGYKPRLSSLDGILEELRVLLS